MELMNRIVVVGSVVFVCSAFACSAPPEERKATSAQHLSDEGGMCEHAICATGVALMTDCDPCVTSLCAQDPYCCGVAWDATCVGEVTAICGQSCTPAEPPPTDPNGSTCSHPICATGPALETSCEPCVASLCAQDPYCCGVTWDATCVGEVTSICGQSCN